MCCNWKQFYFSVLLGLGLAWITIIPWFATDRLARAAPGDVYCVVPDGEMPGSFTVCDQVFTTVQQAVDSASGGEEIRVASGAYTDIQQRLSLTQVVYISQTVTIRGGYTFPFTLAPDPIVNPAILDAQGGGRVLYITGEISPTIEGLHLTGGKATDLGGHSNGDAGGGVYASGANVTLNNNAIYNNIATDGGHGFGGGVYLSASNAFLDGNTIWNNIASQVDDGAGGGVGVEQSVATLSNNTVFSNTASLSATFFALGGGINVNGGMVALSNNTILSNTALISGTPDPFSFPQGFGGGISVYDSESSLTGNTIQGNIARYFGWGFGGGIAIQSERPVTVSKNLIQGNVASVSGPGDGYGGGISVLAPTTIMIIDNTILHNIAAISGTINLGGGVATLGYDQALVNIALIENTILHNTAGVSGTIGAAGGVFLTYSDATLIGNTIISNTALISGTGSPLVNVPLTGGLGGGLFVGNSRISLDRSLIQANIASHSNIGLGGGLYLETSEAILTNTVVTDNRAATVGAGISIGGGSEVDLIQTTIARNQGGDGSGLHLHDLTVDGLASSVRSTVALTNAILANQAVGIIVTGNNTATVNSILWHATPITVGAGPRATVSIANQFSGDPAFGSDGYHILIGSRAIDRGVMAGAPVDIDNQPRSGLPDLGADEYVGPIHQHYFPLIRRGE